MLKKKKKNTKYVVAAVVVITLILITVVAVGYIGLVRIPFISPSPQSYSNAQDLTGQAYTLYSTIQQYASSDLPSLATIESYGFEVHVYGTDDAMSVVIAHYDGEMSGWTLESEESDTYYVTKIWRRIAYGFALMAWTHPQMKTLAGYNTIYMTVDGPMTAWLEFMDTFD